MDWDQDPWVPAPRDGGREATGYGDVPFLPTVPAPRVAPALERLPEPALPSPRLPVSHPTVALVPVPVVREAEVPGLLRTWGRAVTRAVHVAVDGVRSLLDALVPAPAAR